MEKNDLIDNWLTQEASAEDRAEMERIIRFTEGLQVPERQSKEQAWEQLMSSIEEASGTEEHLLLPEQKRSRTWYLWAASVAAVLVVSYFTLLAPSQGLVSFQTSNAEILTQTLPLQSTVTLNAGSSISYDENTWESYRDIRLQGEAFFEVTKGQPFKVSTDAGSVTVLGTSFNVYQRGDNLSVECFTGKVSVQIEDQKVLLTANEKASIDTKTKRLIKAAFNPQKVATWRIGEFYFDAVELTEVIEELERQFNIEIEVKGDISNRFYTGFFSTQNLTEALQLVFVPMGLNAKANGNSITIE